MEKYEPTAEEMQAAEENLTEEQQASSERREDVRTKIKEPHAEVEFDPKTGAQLVGEEKEPPEPDAWREQQ